MTLRSRRILLRAGLHGGVIAVLFLGALVGALAGSGGTSGFFFVVMLGYVATLRVNPLPRLFERQLLQKIECPACGQVMEMVSTWSCGCGFDTWEPRHALAPCPNCGKSFAWLQCPSCQNGMRT